MIIPNLVRQLATLAGRQSPLQKLATPRVMHDEGQQARNSCPELRIFFLLASHGLLLHEGAVLSAVN